MPDVANKLTHRHCLALVQISSTVFAVHFLKYKSLQTLVGREAFKFTIESD